MAAPNATPERSNEPGFVSASLVLQQLHDSAPVDHFTLDWALERLRGQSFGVVLLVLAIAALAPGICSFIGVLIAGTAIQMMIGRTAAYFPAVIGRRPLPARHLRRIVPHAIAALRCIERHIHPRWPALVAAAKPLMGIIVLALSGLLIFLPLPFSNIALALSIAAISVAYLESDGILLMISLLAGLALIIFNSVLVWTIVWNLL